jgi:ATP-binding protein involved in chromosome partitioning
MSYFTPAELPDNKYYIFGKEGGKKLSEEYELPFLGQIPLVQGIREGGDLGVPAMVGDDPVTRQAFIEFAGAAVRSIAMRNANLPQTKVLEVVS